MPRYFAESNALSPIKIFFLLAGHTLGEKTLDFTKCFLEFLRLSPIPTNSFPYTDLADLVWWPVLSMCSLLRHGNEGKPYGEGGEAFEVTAKFLLIAVLL